METVADLISSRWFLVNFSAPLKPFDIRPFALLCILKYTFSNYNKPQFAEKFQGDLFIPKIIVKSFSWFSYFEMPQTIKITLPVLKK